MSDTDLYKRMFERERAARREAERLLESKSLELWNTNQRLQKSAEELESIFVATSDGILTFDANGLIKTVNPAAKRIFGYEESQILEMDIADLLPDEEIRQEMVATSFWVDMCTEDHPHVSSVGMDANGKTFAIELSASRGKRNDEILHIWVLRNTERINQMERQSMVNQRLQAIGQLAAGVSHEINTPIQYVHENTKFLRDAFQGLENLLKTYEATFEELEDTMNPDLIQRVADSAEENEADFYREEVPRAIEETISGSQRVSSIVKAIKEFAHPGANEKAPFDINAAVKSAMTVSSNHWKHVSDIETDLAPGLEEVHCYGSDINQILLNLIVNASDAIADRAESDGIRGLITIKTWQVNRTAKISVSDTGCGIARKHLEQIFTPFFTTKSVGKGTGQGLALVHSVIVERHGGQVDVDSEQGVGTTFELSIPMGDNPLLASENSISDSGARAIQ